MVNNFQLATLIERVRTRSVLAPLIALDIIAAVGAVAFSALRGPVTMTWLPWGIFGVCVIATIGAFAAFAICDPDRLQTEDYRLARHRLDVIGDERDPNNPSLIEAAPTNNPQLIEAASSAQTGTVQ
jgi:hypothetical protein